MRTETIVKTYYKFDELSPEAQDRAIEACAEFNVSDEFWYECILEEAKELGFEIQGFDHSRGNEIEGVLDDTPRNICKAIMDGLGGRIGFDSIAGSGATFYFELPESREGGARAGHDAEVSA